MKRLSRQWIAFLLAMVFLASPLLWGGLTSPQPVQAVTQAEIDALEAQADEIAAAQSELRGQLAIISKDKSNAVARKNLLEQEINLINAEIANTEAQIELFDGLIFRKIEEIQAAEAEERRQYQLFCDRVRIMEEAGEVSYWGILFSASDFSELLDRIVMIDEIMSYDQLVMDQLIAIREQIIREREALEVLRQEQEVIYLKQQEAKAEKQVQEAEVVKLIAEIAAQEAELKALEAELDKAASDMDAQIKKKEEELAAEIAAKLAAQLAAQQAAANAGNYSSSSSPVYNSGFIWPLSSYSTLSSLFGGRIHPITGKASSHSGVDVPAPSGTPILAAKAGVILTSAYDSSYGNYVVVSHGNGQTTLYAHMVSRGVAEGTTVAQGQVVGYVGTTGSSTGNHLHYEIRVNGVRSDPLNYYPERTFYMSSGGVLVAVR